MTDMDVFGVSTQALNVLVVDDSRAMLGVISEILKELGVKSCSCVTTGEEAIQLIKRGDAPFHVLFVDLNMPGMDGMELVHELAKLEYTGGIVILSNLDNKILQLAGEITKKHRVHLIGCLSKPITQQNVAPTLQKLKTLHRVTESRHQSLSADEVQKAIQQQWIAPYYQPLVNNSSGKVYCLEVLARIIHPGERNAIAAGQFIETAEQQGLIEQLTLLLFAKALDEFPKILSEFGADCRLSINISPLLLSNKKLPDQLKLILSDREFNAGQIILEITEGLAIENRDQFETINRLRIQGFDLALDDYGTGFTNIQQLKSLPYTEIKIDRSLVYGISQDKLSQVVANSLFDIFNELNVNVVAEGVESAEDLNYLNELPIPINLQGYIISKPKALDNILRWHRSWQKILNT